jgi:hypothetical protein
MLISLKHRIALLAMPKTASTSLEAVLAGSCDIVLQHAPGLKHTPLRKFERFLRPFLTSVGVGDIETACLFRDPVSWLASWYAYRSRSAISDTAKSTGGISFDRFVQAYLSPEPPEFARVGRQSRFASTADGVLAVDHLFAYEEIDTYIAFLEHRFGIPIALPRLNASGKVDRALSRRTRQLLEKALEEDFSIHRALIS